VHISQIVAIINFHIVLAWGFSAPLKQQTHKLERAIANVEGRLSPELFPVAVTSTVMPPSIADKSLRKRAKKQPENSPATLS
jgi:hypothetical protein